jgi:hypothetical protein
MKNEYTRQRQGRDFTLLEEVSHLRNAELSVEGNYNNIDGIIGNAPLRDDFEAKTLLEQLEYSKAVSERNAVPVDGCEPPQERPAQRGAR